MKKLYTLIAAIGLLSTEAFAYMPEPYTDGMSLTDFEGDYVWSYYGMLYGNIGRKQDYITVTLSNQASGEVEISGLFYYSLQGVRTPGKVKAYIDLSNATFTIPTKQVVHNDSDGDVYFYIKDCDDNGEPIDGASDIEAAVGRIYGSTVVFDREVWAVGNAGDFEPSWYTMTDQNGFILKDALDRSEKWNDYGTALFNDAWVVPAMDAVSTNGWHVDIQQNAKDPSLFRIVNPYTCTGSPVTGSVKDGFIEFSIANPDIVTVTPRVPSGYIFNKSDMYFYNTEGFIQLFGSDFEAYKAANPDVEFSTYDAEAGVVNFRNCCFDQAILCSNTQHWSGVVDKMNGTLTFDNKPSSGITLPGSNSVESRPTYYNLQGQAVQNPSQGIFIRVQNCKSQKVYIRNK